VDEADFAENYCRYVYLQLFHIIDLWPQLLPVSISCLQPIPKVGESPAGVSCMYATISQANPDHDRHKFAKGRKEILLNSRA
jgi:hypothetical protein